ncbi:MAG: NADH:ubiquinone reductase (Na(+)-transporting) subunit C [Flavobacteriales bacterium]|nr:NADH:ubiquinone reductase (Na(+)-transporting) subunit C [Flavobacteriales bacterium]
MNKESNIYTFTFAIIMVLVIGILLAVTSELLQPRKKQNKNDKKMMDILSAINIDASRENAQEQYDTYISSSSIIDNKGSILQGDAFKIDVLFQYRDKTLLPEERRYPLFKANKDGEEYFIVPMVGSGLWGPIWGFVALENDYNTIYGAAFDHKTETPGLGAEINQDFFEQPFVGKKIIDNKGMFVSIDVQKGGADRSDPHAVDGITGGTITSDGVTDMLKNTLMIYNKYFSSLGKAEIKKDTLAIINNNID